MFQMNCKDCGCKLKHRDYVKRITKTKGGVVNWISVQRLICSGCGQIHRILPDNILPFKHYEAEIIEGVLAGLITPEDLECEDYPCEMTMIRWKSQHNHIL